MTTSLLNLPPILQQGALLVSNHRLVKLVGTTSQEKSFLCLRQNPFREQMGNGGGEWLGRRVQRGLVAVFQLEDSPR